MWSFSNFPSNSIERDVHLINDAPIKTKIDDKAKYENNARTYSFSFCFCLSPLLHSFLFGLLTSPSSPRCPSCLFVFGRLQQCEQKTKYLPTVHMTAGQNVCVCVEVFVVSALCGCVCGCIYFHYGSVYTPRWSQINIDFQLLESFRSEIVSLRRRSARLPETSLPLTLAL